MGSLYDITKYVGLALSILAVIVVALLWFDVLLSTSVALNLILTLGYIILLLIIASVGIFSIVNTANDKSSLKSALLGVGSFLGLFIICILVSSGTETMLRDGDMLSSFSSKLISGSITMFFTLNSIAIVYMLFFNFTKKSGLSEKNIKMGVQIIPAIIIVLTIISSFLIDTSYPSVKEVDSVKQVEVTKKETKDVDMCKCLTLPGNSVYMQENIDACNDAISKEIGVENWRKVNMSLPNNAKISAKFDKLAEKCM